MRILVTGAAGFIGSKTAELLLSAGHHVIGVDNLNDAYDRRLKDWRLARLRGYEHFRFHHADISNQEELRALFDADSGVSAVINLAARAGVRQSVQD
ncbi:MAG: SDR family NAD(P)-dependent oxidoreductase, partial [Candidatus Limnocylindrales bacterium]